MLTAVLLAAAKPGIGHLRRCLVLAGAMRRQGVDCILAALHEPVPAAVADEGYRPLEDVVGDLPRRPDIAVVDTYWPPEDLLGQWSAEGTVVAAIDDLCAPSRFARVVVNPSAHGQDCAMPEADGRLFLLGVRYALVDPVFATLRGRPPSDPARVLISFGGSDDGSYGLSMAAALRHAMPERPVTVALPREPRGSVGKGVTVRVRPRMVDLMEEAGAFVGAAGQTVYEALAAGRPLVCAPIADNQEVHAAALARYGVPTLAIYEPEALAELARLRLHDAGGPEVDGCGAKRVAAALIGLTGTNVHRLG